MRSKNRLAPKLMIFVTILIFFIPFSQKTNGQDITEVEDDRSSMIIILNILDGINPVASNDGVGELASKIGENITKMKELANGIAYDSDGKQLTSKAFKRLIRDRYNITGAGHTKQINEVRKSLGETAKKWRTLERFGTAISIVDPASKVFGALYAEDYYGAVMHTVSGACKYGATTIAGAIGTTAGSVVGPQGAIIGGAVAAGTGGAAYDSYIQPFFDEKNKFNTNVNTIEKNANKFMLEAYDTNTREAIYAYMKGDINQEYLRKLIKDNRKNIDKQRDVHNRKRKAQRLELVAKLRTTTDNPPEISKLIDLYEKDKLNNTEKNKLLAYLQHKNDAQCAQEETADNLINEIFKLNHAKLLATLKELKITPSESYMNCLCRGAKYGTSITKQFYHPGTLGEYDSRYSCQHPGDPCIVAGSGCLRHPLPKDIAIVKDCIETNLVGMEKDKDGKTLMKKGPDGKVLKDKNGNPMPTEEKLDKLIYENIKTIAQQKYEEQRQRERKRALELEIGTPFLTKPVK